jgi:hypothetical protein
MDFADEVVDELSHVSQIDIKDLAVTCMLKFFEDKEYESGGRISRKELLKKEHLANILNYTPASNFVEGLCLLHEILSNNEPPEGYKSDLVDWEVKLLNELLKESARAGVPKNFAIGITLMNLQYCYGMNKWRIWN